MDNGNIKNRVHFSFILFFIWFLFTKNLAGFIVFCLSVMTHEYGHYFVAKKRGYKLDNFCIAPYGICLNYKEKFFQPKDEIAIAIAGPCMNFALSLLCCCLWWIFPSSYNFTVDFVYHSITLGFFNLLPCYPLDGGRVCAGALSNSMPRKKAIKILTILNVVIASIMLILFILSCFVNFNPSLCLTGVFMIFSILDNQNECKYEAVDVFNKKIKHYTKTQMLSVDKTQTLAEMIKHIEVNKFTVFVVILSKNKIKLLDEQAVKVLSLSYPVTTTLSEIFTQDKA